MAKFTIFFKDKAIQSSIFDSGTVRIGRDSSNDLIIDNLTVAPAHAIVTINPDNCIIKQLSDENPLIINGEQNKEAFLQNNDKITVGKHSIIFSTTESITPATNISKPNKDVESLNSQLENKIKIPDANLQVLSGSHIGRILPLKKAMTRIGHPGTGVVIISKRKDGFFISSLEKDSQVSVNQERLEDKIIPLNNNDIILINKVSMQFFLEPLS